jgi:hypothetical protein
MASEPPTHRQTLLRQSFIIYHRSLGAFGKRTLNDLSEFFSDDSALISEKNPL